MSGKRGRGGYPQALSKQDMTRGQGMSIDSRIYACTLTKLYDRRTHKIK